MSTNRKERQDKYNKEYYTKKRESRKAQILERQRGIRNTIQAYKIAKGCSYCGYNKSARALHFHHKGDAKKEHIVSRMASQGRSIDNIMKEVAKCVVVCANCHAELHESEYMER